MLPSMRMQPLIYRYRTTYKVHDEEHVAPSVVDTNEGTDVVLEEHHDVVGPQRTVETTTKKIIPAWDRELI